MGGGYQGAWGEWRPSAACARALRRSPNGLFGSIISGSATDFWAEPERDCLSDMRIRLDACAITNKNNWINTLPWLLYSRVLYSLNSLNTTLDSSNTEIRFGIAISPLNASDTVHTKSNRATAPTYTAPP